MAKTAFLSVSDTTGLSAFARSLVEDFGYQLIASEGVTNLLRQQEIPVQQLPAGVCVDDVWIRNHEVDLVVAHCPPLEERFQGRFLDPQGIMNQFDIGGASLLRRAAMCGHEVMVVCEQSDYDRVVHALAEQTPLSSLRRELAAKTFQKTAQQDLAIARFWETCTHEPDLGALSGFPKTWQTELTQTMLLPQGENPHQQAALYGRFFDCLNPLQGEPLCFTHIMDASTAVYLIGEFEKAAVALIRRGMPIAVASAETLEEAWESLLVPNSQELAGCVMIANRTLDERLSRRMADAQIDVMIAPCFTEDALKALSLRQAIRLLAVRDFLGPESLKEIRSVIGGILVQDRDTMRARPGYWQVASTRQPSAEEWAGLSFGWKVAKHAKSSAVVLARGEQTLGISSGQSSPIESMEGACLQANRLGVSLDGAVLVSDSALDSAAALEFAVKKGIRAILHPGDKRLDAESLRAANLSTMAVVFSGTQHVRS